MCISIPIPTLISPVFRCERLLHRLEVLDGRQRERAGLGPLVLGTPVPIMVQPEQANEVRASHSTPSNLILSIPGSLCMRGPQYQSPPPGHAHVPRPLYCRNSNGLTQVSHCYHFSPVLHVCVICAELRYTPSTSVRPSHVLQRSFEHSKHFMFSALQSLNTLPPPPYHL